MLSRLELLELYVEAFGIKTNESMAWTMVCLQRKREVMAECQKALTVNI
jgi:hypothetical protein